MPRPPFRADHVGSFLRPERLREARERFAAGGLPAAELHAIEDACIREVVRAQENVGLKGITDGEFRRTFFHVDFLERFEGVETHYGEFVAKFRKDDGSEVGFKPPTMHVGSKVKWVGPIQGADFDFLKSTTTRMAKVCIPAPSMLHFRGGREAISEVVYPRLETFYDDLTAAYRAEIADLAARGLRYLQFDDTNLAYLCDPEIRARTKARGDDPDALVRLYCRLINDSIRDRPADMTVCVHLCRGNFKSAWVAQGGYEPVAEILLNEMKIDGFFLEYDDERSGDFAPAALCAEERDHRARAHELQEGRRGAQRRGEASHRRGDEIRGPRTMRAEPSVRILLHRARQRPQRSRPMDQARASGRNCGRGVGRGVALSRVRA